MGMGILGIFKQGYLRILGIFSYKYSEQFLWLIVGKENTDKHEARFLDLDIKIRNGKFQVDLFDEIDLFLFFFVLVSDKSSNVAPNVVNFAGIANGC